MERTPIEGLALIGWNSEQFKTLVESVDLTRLRTLELIYSSVALCGLVRTSSQVTSLERLLIRQPFGNADLCDVLAGGEIATGVDQLPLRELQLRSCDLSEDGFSKLLRMPWIANLECLGIPDCVGPVEILLNPLFRPDQRPRLRRLNVSGASVSHLGQTQLAEIYGDILVSDTTDAHYPWPEMYQFG